MTVLDRQRSSDGCTDLHAMGMAHGAKGPDVIVDAQVVDGVKEVERLAVSTKGVV